MNKTCFLDSQIDRIRKIYPTLTKEQEKDLAIRMKNGDSKAADILFFTVMGLIRKEVKNIHINNAEYEDMMQDAYAIVLKKRFDFDEKRGFRFSTFIWPWVWQEIMKRNLKVSNRDYLFVRQVTKAEETLCQEFGEEPSDKDVADYLQIDYEVFKKKKYRIFKSKELSLDAPVLSHNSNNDECNCLQDIVEDDVNVSPEDLTVNAEVNEVFLRSLEKLSPKERQVFVACHGKSLENLGKGKSYHIVGNELGYSHEGVRGIDIRAKEKMRRFLVNEGILAA